jgi:outer membrane protein insertion porin family
LSDEKADLDLILKEAKTGNFNFQMGFGGAGLDIQSPASGFNVKLAVADRNLFGSGINMNLETSWAKNEQTIAFHLAQPWLFDKPISGAFDVYHRRPMYDTLAHIAGGAVREKVTGVAGSLGLILRSNRLLLNGTNVTSSLGFDNLSYQQLPQAAGLPEAALAEYQILLNKEFIPAQYVWVAGNLEQDVRNHPIHTSRGYRWTVNSRVGMPSFNSKAGFYKVTLDAAWFTPIIGEQDLVFRLHGFFGFAEPLKNHLAPYEELFNIGGPSSVRGFLFGQIGPKFEGDPIGAKKAFFVNVELVFPITPDLNMKGCVFYDGGAGFDNPNVTNANKKYIRDNNFDYRHAVGFGVRVLSPMPIKVDWGFKIDPRTGESASEVHFGSSYEW